MLEKRTAVPNITIVITIVIIGKANSWKTGINYRIIKEKPFIVLEM